MTDVTGEPTPEPAVGDVLYLPVTVAMAGLSDPTNGPYVKGRVVTSPAQQFQTWSISVECLVAARAVAGGEPPANDFYEDDEPIEDLLAIINSRPPDGVTAPPASENVTVAQTYAFIDGKPGGS